MQCPIPKGGALAIASLLERQYYFSLDMWLLLGQPRSRGQFHTQEYMGSTVELSGLKCKKGHKVWWVVKGASETSWCRGEYNQNILY